MVLAHRAAQVREYVSLTAHTAQDGRVVHASVDAFAHPAKRQRMPPHPQRDALARLHAAAVSQSWDELRDIAQHIAALPETMSDSSLQQRLTALLGSPSLRHLQRLEELKNDELVRRYRSLLDRRGPRTGSAEAVARGVASKQRGAATEAAATAALGLLVRRLNEVEHALARYRLVTSMRVPASLCADAAGAKTEWDTVLLEQPGEVEDSTIWNVRLLVEAKASADAATTDFARLLRGLRLLATADEHAISFETRQGAVRISGASLRRLPTSPADLQKTVLYCCDARAEQGPRLLDAAARMRLLSSPHSLDYASALAEGHPENDQYLEAVWHQLLESPRWLAVLDQYPTLRLVRELMVHPDDLKAAIDHPSASG